MSAVAFSGYIIEQGDLRPDPAKVKAVVEWPEPPNQCQLQQFLGFANFYRRFIQDFSMVTLPDKQGGPCFSHVSIFPSLTGQGPATSSLTTSPNSSPPRRTRRSLHPSSQLPASWELFPEKSSQPFRRLKGWNQIQEADLVPLFPSIEGEHSVPQQTHRRPPPDLYP